MFGEVFGRKWFRVILKEEEGWDMRLKCKEVRIFMIEKIDEFWVLVCGRKELEYFDWIVVFLLFLLLGKKD